MFRPIPLLAVVAGLAAMPAAAGTLRPLCASRPGIGTPPCILDKQHAQVEVGLVTSQSDTEDGIALGTTAFGSTEISYGIDGNNQVSVFWAPLNLFRVTDPATGEQRETTGLSDVALRWRHSLRNPDGEGLSLAIEGLVNIPVGKQEITTSPGAQQIGSNKWGFGLLLPVSVAITDTLAFVAAPGFIWSENDAPSGQHFDYDGSFGLAKTLGTISLTVELGYSRDGEPESGKSSATVSGALAWSPSGNENLQLDVGVSVAANKDAPDLQVYLGVVKRF